MGMSGYVPSVDTGMLSLVEDTSPQLGGNLDMNSHNIEGVTPTEMGHLSGVSSAIQAQLSAKLANVVDDASPQLGGDLGLNGNQINGVQLVDFLPIGWAIDGSAPPAELETITDTNKVEVRKFDPNSDEDVQIVWVVPNDAVNSQDVQFRVICLVTESTPPSNEGWAFFLAGSSRAQGHALNLALGTAVKSSITGRSDAQNDFVFTAWSNDLTITGLSPSEICNLKLYRDVSDGDDDYGQDIGVIGIEIRYVVNLSE